MIQFTGYEKTYTKAFDSLAETLSSDGFGRLVTWLDYESRDKTSR